MLPFALPAWESDATMRGAVTTSYAQSVTSLGESSLLSGAEAKLAAATHEPEAAYGAELGGLYARVLTISATSEDPPPADNVAADLAMNGTWETSPHTSFSLDSHGYLASRLGVRAFDELAARDPFLGDRLQYTVGGGAGFHAATGYRSGWTFSGGYAQMGALTADSPDAVGIDAHVARSGVAYSFELSRVDMLTPEVRYVYTHYNHALYDVFLNRGPADVHAGTALLSEAHAFTRRVIGTITGGVTVATPPPILDSQDAIVSPEARVAIAYNTRRWTALAGYAYTYTSLGPRIGFGATHSATAELDLRPVQGGKFRDLVLRTIGRFDYGSAPLAASPPLGIDPGADVPEGVVTTYTAVGGFVVDYPIARGIAVTGGLDLEWVKGVLEPAPPTGEAPAGVRTIATLGIAGILSSDPESTVRRDRDSDKADEREALRTESHSKELETLLQRLEGTEEDRAREALLSRQGVPEHYQQSAPKPVLVVQETTYQESDPRAAKELADAKAARDADAEPKPPPAAEAAPPVPAAAPEPPPPAAPAAPPASPPARPRARTPANGDPYDGRW